ncbi:hypothetical protein NC651_013174 [Populus alba x Populus x berolinensis]|nr:hypothetical protein NC651_013174 [Populus alba x Populus x berolinensis]
MWPSLLETEDPVITEARDEGRNMGRGYLKIRTRLSFRSPLPIGRRRFYRRRRIRQENRMYGYFILDWRTTLLGCASQMLGGHANLRGWNLRR